MREGEQDQMTLIVVSAIPLFYGASGMGKAFFMGGSVLLAVLVFEMFYFLMRRFWMRSLIPLLAVIILSCVLKSISLVAELFLKEPIGQATPIFPLTLVSAFLLAYRTVSSGKLMPVRMASWVGFFALLWFIGMCRESSGLFHMFPSGPFWISGIMLGALALFKKRVPR